jgi:hypothetical protein
MEIGQLGSLSEAKCDCPKRRGGHQNPVLFPCFHASPADVRNILISLHGNLKTYSFREACCSWVEDLHAKLTGPLPNSSHSALKKK